MWNLVWPYPCESVDDLAKQPADMRRRRIRRRMVNLQHNLDAGIGTDIAARRLLSVLQAPPDLIGGET